LSDSEPILSAVPSLRHSDESRNPCEPFVPAWCRVRHGAPWTPAFAGVTTCGGIGAGDEKRRVLAARGLRPPRSRPESVHHSALRALRSCPPILSRGKVKWEKADRMPPSPLSPIIPARANRASQNSWSARPSTYREGQSSSARQAKRSRLEIADRAGSPMQIGGSREPSGADRNQVPVAILDKRYPPRKGR
jgi:hypothetical protein